MTPLLILLPVRFIFIGPVSILSIVILLFRISIFIITLLVYLAHRHFMNGLFYQVTISLSDEVSGNVNRVSMTVIPHSDAFLVIAIDHNSHNCAKFLYILYLFDKVAIPSLNHNNRLVPIK